VVTNVSEESIALYPEDGGDMSLRNFDNLLHGVIIHIFNAVKTSNLT
jgi:hypothetical protein